MQFEQWDRLRPIGLTPPVMQALAALDAHGEPMRVTEVHRDRVILADGEREFAAQLLPVVRRELSPLAVGDWVAAERDEQRPGDERLGVLEHGVLRRGWGRMKHRPEV